MVDKNNESFIYDYEDEKHNLFDDPQHPMDKEKKNGKEILEMIVYFLIVIGLVLFIHRFVGLRIEVSGSSMERTLHNEDQLILEKVSYKFNDPKRFDIIVFRPYANEDNTYYIKRVIGLPGESIQIIDSDIFINGDLLDESYGNQPMEDNGLAEDIITLGEDEYFVLGDNRNHSTDSRDIGAIHRSSIIGRAWMRIWPLNDIEILKHQ